MVSKPSKTINTGSIGMITRSKSNEQKKKMSAVHSCPTEKRITRQQPASMSSGHKTAAVMSSGHTLKVHSSMNHKVCSRKKSKDMSAVVEPAPNHTSSSTTSRSQRSIAKSANVGVDHFVEYFVNSAEVEVHNVVGSSASSLRNAKKHWISQASVLEAVTGTDKSSKKRDATFHPWHTCRKLHCNNNAEHGAHVKVPSKSWWDWYIVPLCHKCNPRSSNAVFHIKPNTLLVKDHKASTFTHMKSWIYDVRPLFTRAKTGLKNIMAKLF